MEYIKYLRKTTRVFTFYYSAFEPDYSTNSVKGDNIKSKWYLVSYLFKTHFFIFFTKHELLPEELREGRTQQRWPYPLFEWPGSIIIKESFQNVRLLSCHEL